MSSLHGSCLWSNANKPELSALLEFVCSSYSVQTGLGNSCFCSSLQLFLPHLSSVGGHIIHATSSSGLILQYETVVMKFLLATYETHMYIAMFIVSSARTRGTEDLRKECRFHASIVDFLLRIAGVWISGIVLVLVRCVL
jgi:hypothetical protein